MRGGSDTCGARCGSLVLVVSMCLIAVTRAAAGQQTAAGIIGQVKDESGGVLPGVTVTATSSALQVPSVIDVTNEQGEYRLTPLPIGLYTVEYALSGFQTVRRENLRLEIGVVPRMDVVLTLGSIAETLTVSGVAPVVDVTSTGASTQFTRETLLLTPTSRNGIISLGSQAPGVRGRIDYGGSSVGDPPEFKVFGQSWNAWITVEGMVTNDPRNSGMGGNYWDYDAVEEARVQSISNSPEVASHGVAITMVMKSGGNDFHGSGQYGYTSHRLESNNIDASLRAIGITHGNPLDKRTDHGGELGGRILRNKLWFYGSARYRQNRWLTLGGFKPDGSQADAYRGTIDTNDKLSLQLSAANRFIFWHSWAQKYHYGEGVGEFQAWESRGDRKPPIRANTWKVDWQGTRGNSLVMSLLFGRWAWTGGSNIGEITHNKSLEDAGIPTGLSIRVNNDEDHGGARPSTYDIVTLKQAGTPAGGGNWYDVGKYNAKGTLGWYRPDLFLGNHEFKTGFDYAPVWLILGQGDRGPAGQYRLIFNNGTPFQIDLYNYPVNPHTETSYLAAYGNDTWTIARRLTLDVGLRYARDNPVIPAQCRLAGAWPFAAAGCIDKIQFKIWNSIATRTYFSFDVDGSGKTVIKGGWGRFNRQRVYDDVAVINPFQQTTTTFRWRDLNGNRNYDAGDVDLNPNGPDFVRVAQPINGVNNPNEKVPRNDQLSLTLERQLVRDFALRVSGVYIRTFNEPRYLNILRPHEAYNIPITNPDPGPDNRVGTPDDPGRFITYYDYPAALAGRKNELFIITEDPRANETHTSIDLQVIKRISNRWQFLASYTATKNDTLLPGTSFGRGIPFWDPNVEINSGDHTWEWVTKISGTYQLPAEVTLSANFDYESGAPQARQVLFSGGQQIPTIVLNVEPLGSIRLPSTTILDFRAQKSFSLPRGHKATVRANLYNALNVSTVTARIVRSGPSYLRPTSIAPPRIVEFGVSYIF